jgi:glycosyltransferase involved in cell wall biosynthesis
MVDLLIVTRSFYPKEGGAERQLRQVAGRLSAQGYTVVVLTEAAPGLPVTETLSTGVRIARVGSLRLGGRRGAQLSFVAAALVRGFGMRPRVLLSPQLGAASVVAGVVARVRRAPHVVRLTGGGTARFRSEPLAKASSRMGRALARVFARRATTVVAPARHLLADFAEAFPAHPCELVHITNGVEPLTPTPAKTGQVIWYSRGGSETSLETFLQIARTLPEVRFTVIGRRLVSDIPPNVDDLGWQEHPESVISSHLVLLNTSPQEGMPNTVLQALAGGCRVVGFRNAGMNELQQEHPQAIDLVDAGEVRAASGAVTRALSAGAIRPAKIATISEVVDLWIARIKPQFEAEA